MKKKNTERDIKEISEEEKIEEIDEKQDEREVYLENIGKDYLDEVIALYWMDLVIKQVGFKKLQRFIKSLC